jgi:hypothetical protein
MEKGARISGITVEVSIECGEMPGVDIEKEFSGIGDSVTINDIGTVTVTKDVTNELEYHRLVGAIKKMKHEIEDKRDEIKKM